MSQELEENPPGKKPSSGGQYLLEQAGDLFSWLSGHVWAASGLLIFVFTVYLNAFIIVEKVPLSILSSSLIASFSVFFAYLVLFVFIVSLLVLMPVIVFFTSKMGDENEGVNEFINHGRVINLLCWCLINVVICLAFIAIEEIFFDIVGCAFLVSFLLIYVGALFLLARLMRPRPCLDLGFFAVVLFSVFFQMLFLLVIFSLLLQNSGELDYWEMYLITILVPVCFAVIQMIFVWFLKKTLVLKDALKQFVLSLLLFVFFFGFFPETGSFLFGKILAHTSSGARPCAIVFWTQKYTPAEARFWADTEKQGQSKPLRILVGLDDYYIARILEKKEGVRGYVESGGKSKPVEFIPRTLVARMDECPK